MYNEEIQIYLDDYKENLNKTINFYKDELMQIRAGRANPKVIERIVVDYYGTPTPLNQMANIAVPEARMITLSVWDQSMLRTIAKAIEQANLGLNPTDDGKIIRLVFPQLNEERRKEILKDVKKLTENTKVTGRNDRRKVLDEFKNLKKDGVLTEDDLLRLEKDVQKTLDEWTVLVDKLNVAKEKDIMEV